MFSCRPMTLFSSKAGKIVEAFPDRHWHWDRATLRLHPLPFHGIQHF